MPLESAMGRDSGLISRTEHIQRSLEKGRAHEEEEQSISMTDDEREQFEILRYCERIYSEARKAREPVETFDVAWDLFNGNVWPEQWPRWRAKITINKIRAVVTFIQAIMTDSKPRISVQPLIPGTEDAADLLSKLVDRDWDENDMQQKISVFVLYGLIWGTAFIKITYDPYADNGRGRHVATPVVPYRVFTNRTATCIDDAEYLIHAEEKTMGWVRRNFPDKARRVNKLRGVHIDDSRQRDRDYIREGEGGEQTRIISAQNVNGNITSPQWSSAQNSREDDGDLIEVTEYWIRDESLEAYARQKFIHGLPQEEPETGSEGQYVLETVGQRIATSEIDGASFMAPIMKPKMKPVMETVWRAKYPNGRLVLIAGGRVVLRDIPNPFQTDGFPWAMWKDYDVGTIWGQGEPIALKDCAIAANRIASQVYDILEKTGNPSYMLDKGAGVNAQSIMNKPGAIIPMDKIDGLKALQPPQIPGEFFALFKLVSDAVQEVSGVNGTITGASSATNTAFATVDSLQESSAAPIRLKVRNLESAIRRIGKLRVQLIQQFDRGERPLRERAEHETEDQEAVVQAPGAASVRFREYSPADLQGQVEFEVVPISSLSTSPASTWNKWMVMYEKHLVDRRWWHEKNRIEGWRTELPRMEKTEVRDEQMLLAAKAKSKPGPAPKSTARNAHRRKAPPPPAGHVPTARDNASIR